MSESLFVDEPRNHLQTILLCTSPLQIVTACSAIDYLAEKDGICRQLNVLLIHPQLRDSTISTIYDLADKLNCGTVLNLSRIYEAPSSNLPNGLTIEKSKRASVPVRARLLVTNYKRHSDELRKRILEEIGHVDEIFCRVGIKHLDLFFINSIGTPNKIYSIDDGIGDYVPTSWKFTSLNMYEVNRICRRKIFEVAKYVFSVVVTGDIEISRAIHLQPRVAIDQSFCVLPRGLETTIGEHLRRNVKALAHLEIPSNSKKVLIVGSLMQSPPHAGAQYNYPVEEEVEAYNRWIEIIKQKHDVKDLEIWYKPHPRIDRKTWIYKSMNLKCSIFDFEHRSIAEVELCNPNLEAVYSVGSTTLLYASKLFGVEAYLIDLSNVKNIHPTNYRLYKFVADQFSIPSL